MRVAIYYSNQDLRLREMRTTPKTRKARRQKLETERESRMVDDLRGRGKNAYP